MGLYDLLEKASRSNPEKQAVICERHRFTYGQFKSRVDTLASAFLSLGIEKDKKIAVIHENCHIFLESYFAAAKIGAVLVPINYRLTPREFVYILNDSQAEVLIVQPEFFSPELTDSFQIPTLKKVILTKNSTKPFTVENTLDYEGLMKLEKRNGRTEIHVLDSSIAQIYYTSGTTGRPKGVILTHHNNRKHTVEAARELKLSSADSWLHVSPLFHLADAWAVWAMTMTAAAHVIIPGFEPRAVLEAIQEHRVTLSNFIPTMLNQLVNFPPVEKYDCSSLRVILSGGAPIAKEVVRKVIDTFGCDYIQTYGLTETSPFLTMSILREDMAELSLEEKLKYKATTGRPFSGVQLKVVNQDGGEVTADEKEVGEVIVRGETITPGYWRLPDETSSRIVDGWLHTRDLAVVNPEGYITIVDRMDDVILTGGENVHSIEVEDVLYSYPGILEAAVIGLPDPVWGEAVTAVVVPKEGEEVTENAVIQFCRERLAQFKSPKKVIFTDHLPKTGSAKIYKYRLREKFSDKSR